MSKLPVSHDLFIQDTSGTPRMGFMLLKERGLRVYQLEDYGTIAPRILTEAEFTQAQLPPEVEAVWFQENWQAGIGGENHRLGAGRYGLQGYIDGTGIDSTATDGRMGVALNTVAQALSPDTGGGPCAGFAKVGTEFWAFVEREPYSYDFIATWTAGTAPINTPCIYTNGYPYEGNTYAPRLSWKNSTWLLKNAMPLGYAYKADADTNWTNSTLEVLFKYMCVADGKLWGAYEATLGADLTLESALAQAATTVYFEGDTTATLTTNDYVIITHNTTTEEIIQLGSTGSYAAGPPARTTYTSCTRGKFGTTDQAHNDAVTANKYTLATTNVRSSVNGTNTGSWAAATTIGDTSAPITGLVPWYNGSQEVLLVCKEDGLWTLTASGTVELLHDLRNQQRTNNFVGAISWDGNRRVLLPLAGGGLEEMYNGSIRDISFSRIMPSLTTLDGQIGAITTTDTAVYLTVFNPGVSTSDVFLLKGELVTIDGETDYRWHFIFDYGAETGVNKESDALAVCGMPNSSDQTIARVLRGVLDRGAEGIIYSTFLAEDVSKVYPVSGGPYYAQTVKWDGNHPLANKRCGTVSFTTAGLGTGANANYIEMMYRVDGGTWTYVTGSAGTSKLTTTPQTLTFAAGITGKVLELLPRFYQGNVAGTRGEILDFRVTAQLRLDTIDLLPCQVYLGEHQRQLNGALEPLSVAARLSQLETWHDQAAEVTVIDPRNTSRSMVFLRGTLKVREVANRYGHEPEYVVGFVLAAV